MSLATGSKLGPYEIVAAIGAGGMGEVYRADDSRLGRTVAIKVLPSTFFQVPERRKRLEREARLLSSLSHPHICHLYDVGQQDGVDYLVMEFLEGETLSARLSRGPLAGEQVLTYGSEIADALEYAHRHGIIHRDLKPGNIMITKQGTKLLDFGLARMDEEAAPVSETLTRLGKSDRKLTEEGVILGTFQYMAPEQLEGKDADARTDIFALGAVLYEMATAKPAFAGKTRASLIASILASEPAPITSLQPLTPPVLERVIKSCLAKDPDARWQSAQDVNLQLKWIRESGSGAGVPVPLAQRRKMRERIAWVLAALLGVIAVALGVREIMRRAPERLVTRFTVQAPPGHSFIPLPAVSISPDGRKLAFTLEEEKGKRTIWVHALDSGSARELPGTEGADVTAWSPDSRFLGYVTEGKLRKVDIAGGLPEVLCDAKGTFAFSWNANGNLLLGNNVADPMAVPVVMINSETCQRQPVSKIDPQRYDFGHQWPRFLPDGRHFLFAGLRTDKRHDVLLGTIGSMDSEILVHNASFAKYAPPGYLFFERDGYLFCQPFNARTLKLSGEAVRVEPAQLTFAGLGGMAAYDVSDNGVLVFQRQGEFHNQMMLVDSTGRQVDSVAEPGLYDDMRVSPDRTRLLMSRFSSQSHTSDIWTYDLRQHNWERLSFSSSPGTHAAVWSPDSQTVIYGALSKTHTNLFRKVVNRAGEPEAIVDDGFDKEPTDWSRDGRYLLFTKSDANDSGDIWVLPLAPAAKPFALTATKFDEENGRFSPDGHWIIYSSDESGRREIYVMPFPSSSGARTQVSAGGGTNHRWSSDGRKIYYLSSDSKIMEVPISIKGASIQTGTPRALFSIPTGSQYEPFDAGRFLVSQQIGSETSPPTVTLNWEAALGSPKK